MINVNGDSGKVNAVTKILNDPMLIELIEDIERTTKGKYSEFIAEAKSVLLTQNLMLDNIDTTLTEKIKSINRYYYSYLANRNIIFVIDKSGLILSANYSAIQKLKFKSNGKNYGSLFDLLYASSIKSVKESLLLEQKNECSSNVFSEPIQITIGDNIEIRGDLHIDIIPSKEAIIYPDLTEYICYFQNIDDHESSALTPSDDKKIYLYERAFEQISEALMVTDLNGLIVTVNKSFTKITGYNPSEVIGKSAHLLSSGKTSDDTYTELWANLKSVGRWQGELTNRRKNGAIYPEWISIETIYDGDKPWRYVANFQDLTIQRAQEKALKRLAQEDALTGLPNRHVMSGLIEQAFERAKRIKCKAVLLFVDLDNFKNINDSLGHLAGDETLILVASRLKKRLRETDTLIRLGGDEFLVVAENLINLTNISLFAQSLIESLVEPFTLSDGRQLFVTCSMGVGIYPDDGDNVEQLLQEADTAMYRAKEKGRNRFELFSPELMHTVKAEFEINSDLRIALKQNELFFEFQPLVPILNDQSFEIEALIRWRHPIRGLVYPGSFINIAERSGIISDISDLALTESCAALRRMIDSGLPVKSISFNIPLHDLDSFSIVDKIQKVLDSNKLIGENLKIELTERDIMKNVSQTKKVLDSLRDLGVRIAIDDFGTGFSSLAYLHLLPLDTLKIDASFITSLEKDSSARAIVRAIVSLGKALDLKVVAEGVETEGQLQALKNFGIDYIQGWIFSKAVSEEELPNSLAAIYRDLKFI